MRAPSIEDFEELERQVAVIKDEVINFLSTMAFTSDPKAVAAAATLGLETLKSMDSKPDFEPWLSFEEET